MVERTDGSINEKFQRRVHGSSGGDRSIGIFFLWARRRKRGMTRLFKRTFVICFRRANLFSTETTCSSIETIVAIMQSQFHGLRILRLSRVRQRPAIGGHRIAVKRGSESLTELAREMRGQLLAIENRRTGSACRWVAHAFETFSTFAGCRC